MQIRILGRLYRHKKFYFRVKNILYIDNRSWTPYVGNNAVFKGWKSGSFVNIFLLIFMLLDPDPHSRIQIRESQTDADPDPQHWLLNNKMY